MKYRIQQLYRDDRHWVWCSESFDADAESKWSAGSTLDRTSSPADIYRELREAQKLGQETNKIRSQKRVISNVAAEWYKEALIKESVVDEIEEMLETGKFELWRPILLVIPTADVVGNIDDRIELANLEKRASMFGQEWIIEDLQPSEFDIVEL